MSNIPAVVIDEFGVTYLDWRDFYFRIESLAHTYLRDGSDAVCYVTSGGMSVAHRLIHALNLTIDKRFIVALPIARHQTHEIQAEAQDVRTGGEYDLRAPPSGCARSIEACRAAAHDRQNAAPLIVLPDALPGLFNAPTRHVEALCLPYALPSQLGCAHWQGVLRATMRWPARGGLLCSDYAERMSVRASDALTLCGVRLERYTVPMLAQIAHNSGFDVLDARPANAHNISAMYMRIRPQL